MNTFFQNRDANLRLAIFACAPYVAWMASMPLFPLLGLDAPQAYAARTALCAALLAAFAAAAARAFPGAFRRAASGAGLRNLSMGLLAGLAVAVLWIAPERFAFYREWFATGSLPAPDTAPLSPYAPQACGAVLAAARLAGSAFVIAPAEELFFRWFLYRRLQARDWTAVPRQRFDLQAFLWMVALFALEHDRFAAGAAAGAIYCLAYMRCGLAAAIAAHCSTNLLLGLWTLATGEWSFW